MGRNLIAPMTRAKMDAALNNTEGLYPKRWGSDFYHRYKEDIALYVMWKWALRLSVCQLPCHVFFQMVMMPLQMKQG